MYCLLAIGTSSRKLFDKNGRCKHSLDQARTPLWMVTAQTTTSFASSFVGAPVRWPRFDTANMKRATEDAIARVQRLCLGFPNAVQNGGVASGVRELSGTRVFGFTVSRRVFARMFVLDPDGDEKLIVWMRADPEEREALLATGHPFFRAGPREVGMVVDGATDWTELAELVTESYLIMAPRKLAAEVRDRLPGRDDDFPTAGGPFR